MLGMPFSYYVNQDRAHGFKIPPEQLRGSLVMTADFAITQSEMDSLVSNDIVVLATDHHEVQPAFIHCTSDTAEGIFINNQYPFEADDNRYLSGAGVFYELICSLYPDFKSEERDALVGVTLLSDIRPIENTKAERYLRLTFNIDTKEGYINYLIESCVDDDYGFGKPKLDRNFVDFHLSPLVNAMLRANMVDEAVRFVLGLGLSARGKSARVLQKRVQKLMQERMTVTPADGITFLSFNTSDFTDLDVSITNYVGLVCNSYSNSRVSVLGSVLDKGKIVRASFRGKFSDLNYREAIHKLGVNAEGHPSAFGITDFEPTGDIWAEIDNVVCELERGHNPSAKVIEVPVFAFFAQRDAMGIATRNCYVRAENRTYIKYIGTNAKVSKETFCYLPLTEDDYANKVSPVKVEGGVAYKYELNGDGTPKIKYREYTIDGTRVKSFGETIETGLILPILDKGYISYYLRDDFRNGK